jgi:multidrug efflux system outer membrane protein
MVGPRYNRPETAALDQSGFVYAGRHNQDVNSLTQTDRWWENFADPVTTELVKAALENNYDLKAAAARVLQAQAAFKQSKGKMLPQLNYNLGRSRAKNSFNFSGSRFSNISTTFSQDISISYVLDLFGKLKHAERAGWAELLATRTNQQALVNSIIAAVIKARIDIATIHRQLDIALANIESRRKTLDIVERRYAQGLISPVDVRLARENLAAAKAVAPAIELSLIRARNGLDVLLGRRPATSGPLGQTLAELPCLEPVNIGIPAALLDRRPDIIAVEMSLRAANELVGVSIAQLYPDLTLTADLGRSADTWPDIWKDETEIYSAVFRLAQPVFRGGQLRAQVEAAKARYAELAADYAATVLKALQETEDALIGEQILQDRLKFVQMQFDQALAAEKLSQQRYQRGLESILIVLESERRRRNAENVLAVLKGRIWTTRVNLFLALGGDWTAEQTTVNQQGV